ncbi:MAG TPA: N-acetylmuramoyl-L-alanine amidase [Candidatus Angelobacter sp.]|nr:N-acetylmuramoyl-L-alanine amidase [Candidatus Angelobacter sp.]
MKIGTSLQKRIAICAATVCLLAPLAEARRTVKEKKQAALAQFDAAEKLHSALEGKAEPRRTRADYEKVLEAYRKVYHTAPNSVKADTSIVTVAELLDEQGRVLHDPKSYSDSIGQLVFLRREYPGSKYRVAALFTIGEIYRDDLRDPVQAKATFEDYLKHYPRSSLASEARKALAEMTEATGRDSFKKKPARTKEDDAIKAVWAEMPPPRGDQIADSAQVADTSKDLDSAASSGRGARKKASEAQTAAVKPANSNDRDGDATVGAPQPIDTALDKLESPPQPRRIAHLTGIRHWSTPDYTRVAIDLEQEVEYQAGRVPHPDRIFFDLYNTKLTSDLIGKSFDVGSGFLHRIRVAQNKAGMARVVLDVDDVAEYSAFLLPNPYRLIIDIHGKLPAQQTASVDRKPALVTKDSDASPTVKNATATKAMADDPSVPDVTVTHIAPAADVTVTHLIPADSKPQEGAVAAAIDRGDKASGPNKKRDAKAHDTTVRTTKTDDAPVSDKVPASGAKGVQLASAEPKKLLGDDAALDESAATTSKPTTGPTFQSVAPQEPVRKRRTPPATAAHQSSAAVASSKVAEPTASGNRSLIRALGLKIGKIVIDAGHGGHDTGTIGPNGLMEKDLVLEVARKLGKLLESRLGAEVVYTRDDDTFIPLETRTAIANKEQADLFVSIHANSSSDSSARGVETYYLNFTSSRDALEVAARENSVSEKSIHELQDLVKKIALKEKIEESRELAADVQKSLYAGLSAKSPAIHNRGVKKAPFIVLIGANMPSILAEISFVSNPSDEKKLKTSEYRQRVAESLYKGIHRYISSLSGIKVAAKAQPASGDTSAIAAK